MEKSGIRLVLSVLSIGGENFQESAHKGNGDDFNPHLPQRQ